MRRAQRPNARAYSTKLIAPISARPGIRRNRPAQPAHTMLRENPAAFREMVFAGLRALEESGKGAGEKTVAQALRPEGFSSPVAPTTADRKTLTPEGVSHSGEPGASSARPQPAAATRESQAVDHDARLAAYASFEKAANEDLERSVGGAIARTIEQALPSLSRTENSSAAGTQHPGRAGTGAAPLQARLSAATGAGRGEARPERLDANDARRASRQRGAHRRRVSKKGSSAGILAGWF